MSQSYLLVMVFLICSWTDRFQVAKLQPLASPPVVAMWARKAPSKFANMEEYSARP